MKRLALIFSITILCCKAYATHIVGGAFSLRWVSGNTYELTLNIMRDCKNSTVGFDPSATVGIFDKATHELIQTYHLTNPSDKQLNFAGSNCSNTLPGECTSLGVYKREIILTPSLYNNDAGYYFSYQRCCRNNIILNIQSPEAAGIAIYMEIPSPKFINNSTPYFTANPNTFLCVGNLTKYNFGFKDPDNDELRYSLVTPINGNLDRIEPESFSASPGPYPRINWYGSHDDSRQVLGNPSLSINPSTGELSVSPVQAGIYVSAVLVEEFRFGVKLGEVRLEIQFNVTECPQPVPMVLYKDLSGNITGNSFNAQVPGQVCFDIEATDANDSLFMTIYNTSADTNIASKPLFQRTLSGPKKITNRVCWQTDCRLDKITSQTYRVEVTDNGCPISTRAISTFSIKIDPMPIVNPTDILCMTLVDNKETIFYWGDSTGNNPYFNQYMIYRSADDGNFIVLDSVQDKQARQYNDNNTPDYSTVNYKYMMKAQNLCKTNGPPSDTLGTFEQLKFIPDQQKLITVSVIEKNKLKITWPRSREKDFARYLIYKTKASDSNYLQILTYTDVDDTVFIDPEVDVNASSYCYHVIMKDTCDNYGPKGLEACSILLKGKASSFSNTISWNPYNYWESGTANYEIMVQGNASLSASSTIVSNNNIRHTDKDLDLASGFFTYYVIAHQKESSEMGNGIPASSPPFYQAESYSNEIELVQRPLVFIPNAFTPNNDKLNEIWDIRNMYVKDYHLIVYNKWGQLVFETTDKSRKWDGANPGGDISPTDVYIYQLKYTGYDNSVYTTKGNVTILR